MGINRRTTYTCDRCKTRKEFVGSTKGMYGIDPDTDLPTNWEWNDGRYLLFCPECAKLRKELEARQKEELDAFMKMKPHSHSWKKDEFGTGHCDCGRTQVVVPREAHEPDHEHKWLGSWNAAGRYKETCYECGEVTWDVVHPR